MRWKVFPEGKIDKAIARVSCFYDHPLYHFNVLSCMDESSIILNVDRKHTEYMRKYYPYFSNVEYLPLSGVGADILMPYEERRIDVLFTGSYWIPKAPVTESSSANIVDAIKWNVQRIMLDRTELSIEEVLEIVLQEYRITVSKEEFRGILGELKDVESYVRAYYRDKLIRTLLKAEIDVCVYGEGWELLKCVGIEHLHILHGDAEVARRALGHTKVALNIMPGFKAGFQERIAAAMLSGAVAVTDVSDYLEEEFCDGKDLIFYDLNSLEEVPDKIKQLLADTERSKQIAATGKRLIEKKHTWKHRVKVMAEQIEKYHGNVYEESVMPGKELEVPDARIRASYVVEKVIVQLSDELEKILTLENCKCLEEEDVQKLLHKMEKWNAQLDERCGYQFFTGTNMDVFILYFKDALKMTEKFEQTVELLFVMLEGVLRGLMEKFESLAKSELLEGMEAGKNTEIYDKMVKQLLKGKWLDKEDEDINVWKEDILSDNDLTNYPSKLIEKYRDAIIDIKYDSEVDMVYVMHHGKKMYYPREYSVQAAYIAYHFCCIEQDEESSHCYLDADFDVPQNSVIIDAGVAEGNFALDMVDRAKKIYLIECDEKWIPALKKTFEPYKDKVVIIQKMPGNQVDEKYTTIDEIVGDERVDFIKMDVEGAEADALLGAKYTLENNPAIKCVVATYHEHGMDKRVMDILQAKDFKTSQTKGYVYYKDYEKPVWENELRHALVRAER